MIENADGDLQLFLKNALKELRSFFPTNCQTKVGLTYLNLSKPTSQFNKMCLTDNDLWFTSR